MKCLNCGAEMADGAVYCASCGYQNEHSTGGAEGTTVLNQSMYTPQPQVQYGPALKFATNRSLVKMFFLSMITFGIYGMVHQSRMADEINMVASRYDGKKTMPYFAMIFASVYTLGILMLVWNHNFANRIGNEARRRGYNTSFGAGDFWLWNVLGSLIIVGPFIYLHRLCKNMNMVNESYNYYG